ncbi:hypothetical protein JCM8097_006601 [Rhodosporidiobolus ruineniae]
MCAFRTSASTRRAGLVPAPATFFALLVGALQVARVSANGSLLTLSETKTLFAFGDSYTQNGYDPALGYDPTAQNVTTSSGGDSWIGYLTQSSLADPLLANNTFNFARGGSTLDANLTYSGYPNMSLSNQVDIFERWFTDNSNSSLAEQEALGGAPDWDGDSTLFTLWTGINDLELAFKRNESWADQYANSTISLLDEQIGRLYSLGARHFLFHLVPPYWLSPLVSTIWADDETAQTTFRENVPLWNDALRAYGGQIFQKYDGTSAMVYETQQWFEVLLSAPETFGFANSTEYCDAYVSNLWVPNADIDAFDESCGVPEAEYVWLDRSHPTFAVHELLAKAVATTLSPGERFPATSAPVTDVSAASGAEAGTDAAATDSSAVSPFDATAPDAIVPLVVSAAPIDPSVPSPVSVPVDPNAGLGYITLENGDTLPTAGVWARRMVKRSKNDSAAVSSSSTTRAPRPNWKNRTRTSASASTKTTSVALPLTSSAAPIDPAIPSPVSVPVDPNAGLGYITLPNGDTLPTGGVWARRVKRSKEDSDVETTSTSTTTKAHRPSWKDRTRTSSSSASTAAADSSSSTAIGTPLVLPLPSRTPVYLPIDVNAGVGYLTLPNGDTIPTGTVWTKRHLAEKEHQRWAKRDKGGMRKIEPTMIAAQREEEQEGKKVGRRDGIWREVKEKLVAGVIPPVGVQP